MDFDNELERDLTEATGLVQTLAARPNDGGWPEFLPVSVQGPVAEALHRWHTAQAALEAAAPPYGECCERVRDGAGRVAPGRIHPEVRADFEAAAGEEIAATGGLDRALSAFAAACVLDALTMAGVRGRAERERIVGAVLLGGPGLPGVD